MVNSLKFRPRIHDNDLFEVGKVKSEDFRVGRPKIGGFWELGGWAWRGGEEEMWRRERE